MEIEMICGVDGEDGKKEVKGFWEIWVMVWWDLLRMMR